MNLHELEIKKQLKNSGDNNSILSLKEILENHGFEFLGNGAEGAVAKHPNKQYVLKIFYSDSQYQNFVQLVQANSSNQHFPKFSRYIKQIPGTKFSYVRMEQLTPCTAAYLVQSHFKEILYTELTSHIVNGSTSVGRSIVDSLENKLIDFDFYLPWDYRNPEKVRSLWSALGEKPEKSWCEAIDKIMQTAKTKNKITLDINYGNIMKRGNTLVVTDPYV
jgi:hypothetical protein